MESVDAIVVGSGAAGAWTAHSLKGLRVLVIDVGRRPPETPERLAVDAARDLEDLRRRLPDLFDVTVGSDFEGLYEICRGPISPKLKAPLLHWIVRDAESLAPVAARGFDAVRSLARGGLANAWGAGAYRFTDHDLEGFPIRAADLADAYDEVGAGIGICGAVDDLAASFGRERDLLPPLPMSRFATGLLRDYERHRDACRHDGLTMGRSRLAVLTEPRHDRPAHAHENLEFLRPWNRSIYSPAYTLEKLERDGMVRCATNRLVTRWRETDTGVEVIARDLDSGREETFAARALFLAAGAMGSARLALETAGDSQSALPLLDNPLSLLPLLRWDCLGSGLDPHDSSLAQLNLVFEDPATGRVLQGSVFRTTGLLRADVLHQYPLSVMASVTADRVLSPAMGVVFLFHSASAAERATLRLRPSGELEISAPPRLRSGSEERLARVLRRLGCWTSARWVRFPPLGTGVHYAGTLPMKSSPGRHETGADGRLAGTRRVWVTDAACFSALPAKNLTFTIMANAVRIARLARRTLES